MAGQAAPSARLSSPGSIVHGDQRRHRARRAPLHAQVFNDWGFSGDNISPSCAGAASPPRPRASPSPASTPTRPPAAASGTGSLFDIPASVTELPTGAGGGDSTGLPEGACTRATTTASRSSAAPRPPPGHAAPLRLHGARPRHRVARPPGRHGAGGRRLQHHRPHAGPRADHPRIRELRNASGAVPSRARPRNQAPSAHPAGQRGVRTGSRPRGHLRTPGKHRPPPRQDLGRRSHTDPGHSNDGPPRNRSASRPLSVGEKPIWCVFRWVVQTVVRTVGVQNDGPVAARSCADAVPAGDDPLEGEALGAERRLQVRQPHRLGIVLGEERLVDELRVAALDEVQDEDLLAGDLGDAVDAAPCRAWRDIEGPRTVRAQAETFAYASRKTS